VRKHTSGRMPNVLDRAIKNTPVRGWDRETLTHLARYKVPGRPPERLTFCILHAPSCRRHPIAVLRWQFPIMVTSIWNSIELVPSSLINAVLSAPFIVLRFSTGCDKSADWKRNRTANPQGKGFYLILLILVPIPLLIPILDLWGVASSLHV